MWIKWASFAVLAMGSVVTSAAASPERWPLWEGYASAFIDNQGRVIDHQGGDRTTSEGQSYGLFFALVADDRDRFDRLLHWTADNLAQGDLGSHLPGWLWGRSPAGEWKLLDRNTAADGDIWIAYTLCEAGRVWHEPAYDILGHQMLALIAAREVAELPGFGPVLLPGVSGFHPKTDSWLLNPSYLPLPIFSRLAALDPAGPWQAIAEHVPSLLEKSARHGFAMDWVSYSPKGGFQPASLPDGKAPPQGSYDAIRVYLWAGLTDPATTGRAKILEAFPGMANYLASHPVPPEKVNSAGTSATGNGPVGFSAALLSYLQALGLKPALAVQTERVMAQSNAHATYYDASLCLFGVGGMQHRFAFGPAGELRVRSTQP